MLALILSALAMTLIVAIRYLLVSGLFAWATARVRPGHYAGLSRQIRMEVGWSLVSCVIYGVPAGIIAWGWQAHGWTRIYTDPRAMPLWWMPVSLLIYLFLHDTWFYWTHRWMHRPAVFRAIHAVHHASRPPTAWAAMNFHPVEAAIVGLFIPLLVFFVPIQAGVLATVLVIMTVMGVTNHMGWEMFPRALVHSRLGHWLITASHHQRHHEQYRCNYGLYFRIWDHWGGTDRGISAP
jgi:sterol desaturase/sphingolipid hydroxylase (fatty acid hydroxylase superfamily)